MKKLIYSILIISSILATSCASKNNTKTETVTKEQIKTNELSPEKDVAQMIIDRYSDKIKLSDDQKNTIKQMVLDSDYNSVSTERERRTIVSDLRQQIRKEVLTQDQIKFFKSKRGN